LPGAVAYSGAACSAIVILRGKNSGFVGGRISGKA
jgi:hypothetical protein